MAGSVTGAQSGPQDVTRLLEALGKGESGAAEVLLPLVYDELRRLAHAQMAREGTPQTLDPTALVHEAYLRLVGSPADEQGAPAWNGRGHFFGAAAQAMRRILVENARRRTQLKRGGDRQRLDLPDIAAADGDGGPLDLLALDEALGQLESRDRRKADVVMLRYFVGLTIEQTALALNISPATVKNEWMYARAWLYRQLNPGQGAAGAAP
jgi:RNA polymerase sigma factor (TIGR02999 family)